MSSPVRLQQRLCSFLSLLSVVVILLAVAPGADAASIEGHALRRRNATAFQASAPSRVSHLHAGPAADVSDASSIPAAKTEADAERASLNVQAARHGPLPPTNREVTLLEAWPNLLMALLAGVSTVLGSSVLFCMPEEGPPPSAMAFALSLAAGVMLTVSFDMFHHENHANHGHEDHDAEHDTSPWWWYPVLFCIGGLLCALMCKLSKLGGDILGQPSTTDSADKAADVTEEDEAAFQRWRLQFLLFIALTAHNFPEGFAVAVSTMSSHQLGIIVCIAIALHNIPEGIALAVAASAAGKTRWEAVRLTLYSGLAEPVGALCALLLLQAYVTPELMQGLLAIVAGVMSYIAVVELLPEALATRCYVWAVCGFLLGIVVMVLTHLVLDSAVPE